MKVNLHYPSLLEEDKEINFYLKFRQFIELIAGTGTKKKFQYQKTESNFRGRNEKFSTTERKI